MRVLALVSCPAKRKVSSALCRPSMGAASGTSVVELLVAPRGGQQGSVQTQSSRQQELSKVNSALQAHGSVNMPAMCKLADWEVGGQPPPRFPTCLLSAQAGQVGSASCRHRVGNSHFLQAQLLQSAVASTVELSSACTWRLHTMRSGAISCQVLVQSWACDWPTAPWGKHMLDLWGDASAAGLQQAWCCHG